MEKVLVTGAGGFIGGHLVHYLKEKGYWVRGVDIKEHEYRETKADEFLVLDLREYNNCIKAVGLDSDESETVDWVFSLAADMGGIGYITGNHAIVLRNNALINLHMLEAAKQSGVKKYLYTSSACVYPQGLQHDAEVKPLKEEDAYPADAEPGYGWEKLMSELAAQYYREDYDMSTYIVRFHNIYGPYGTYDGGREKAPAALCRKAALAKDGDEIEIWGDGEQTRSFCYIDDCVEGLYRLITSDYHEPLNLGRDRLVTINELANIILNISGKDLKITHKLDAPQGVRGRNSDNTRLNKVLGWEPGISLEEGLIDTYKWIKSKISE